MTIMADGTFLAIDYGEKRVGLAIGHSIARIANPYKTIANDDSVLDKIVEVIQSERIIGIVVGLPRNMDGSSGFQADKCKEFAKKLAEKFDKTIVFQEETLSSVEAKKVYSEKIISDFGIDAAAAAVILDRFLDNRGSIT